MTNKTKYLLAALIPLLILLAMTALPLRAYFWGQEIRLETIPVDPSDPFRGDHVILNYKISRVDGSRVPAELQKSGEEFRYSGQKMYALMVPQGEYFQVEKISLEKPAAGVYLPCRFQYREQLGVLGQEDTYLFDFYLDRFFVPDNTGLAWEELSRQGQLVARVRVFGGYALLMGIEEKK